MKYEQYSKLKHEGKRITYLQRGQLLIIHDSKILMIQHPNKTLWLPGGFRHKNGELENTLNSAIGGTKETFYGKIPKGELKEEPYIDENFNGTILKCYTYILKTTEEFKPTRLKDPYEHWQWSTIENILTGKYRGTQKGIIKILKEINK